MAHDPTLIAILDFLRSLGLRVDERPITRGTLVSGVDITGGGLVIDEPRLCMPADVLHEAAHILLTPAADRAALENPLSSSPSEEISAIAWTWAAALHLQIDPAQVFHEQVLSGNGPTLLENFSTGHYVGVPMLQYWGLTLEPHRARERGQPGYPHMLRWARS